MIESHSWQRDVASVRIDPMRTDTDYKKQRLTVHKFIRIILLSTAPRWQSAIACVRLVRSNVIGHGL